MILSCADSRLPPELVFNAGLGDLFVIRSSGGVVDRLVHESCDVVKAAAETKGAAESANLEYLYKAIQAATHETVEDRDDVRSLVLGNVEQVINDTLVKSPLVRRIDAGEIEGVRRGGTAGRIPPGRVTSLG